MYYAHSTENNDKRDWQLLKDHLFQVAELSSTFASDFQSGDLAYAIGLLHDLGKYSDKFQHRLEGSPVRVDHSTAGAREAGLFYNKAQSRILEYIIAGHHTGLLNYGSSESGLQERLLHSIIEDYSAYQGEIIPPDLKSARISITPNPDGMGFSISFFIRMLYSCLVDADSLDTEAFSNPDTSSLRGGYDSLDYLVSTFSAHIEKKTTGAEDTVINRYRKEILDQCMEKADLPPQMFTLTVPTGGGKTLSSMAFALRHLQKNDLKRVFYVIPYTSIIEQNAAIFRDILGERNVLEHHSNFDPRREDSEDPVSKEKIFKISAENWDIPITVTTNVQFFESLFSHKRSRCRKLHNLIKSVIILDEAQMLPTEYLMPSLRSLSELVTNYGCTIVICTATQPKIGNLLGKNVILTEIIHSPKELYERFKRVQITQLGPVSDDGLIDHLKQKSQALCIVNTRKHAQILYDALSEYGLCYHLSAKMCPVHRRKILNEIRDNLSSGKDCRVISTQLIEAGVDVDFPVVYRAMTGIDSVAQAAGRCNREGKRQIGEVFLFSSNEKHGKPIPWQRRVAEIGEMVMESHSDPLSLEAIDEYFHRLYFYEGSDGLDQKKILGSLEKSVKNLSFPFEDVGEAYKLIEENTRDIIIPYDSDARKAIVNIREMGSPGKYVRKLQGYTVGIYFPEFQELEKAGIIETIGDRFHILVNPSWYSEDTGLIRKSSEGELGNLLIA